MRQWVLCATVLVSGCTDADAPPSISVTPILSIGSLDAPAPEVFGEVTDIVVDEAGRIVVLDRLSMEIRLFDAEGAFLGSTGCSSDELRTRASDPEFLGFVLDFLMQDEAALLAFCETSGLQPDRPIRARAALPGGDLPHWT